MKRVRTSRYGHAGGTRTLDLYQGLGFFAVPLLVNGGAHGAIRTRDTRFRRAVLYPLSYVGGAC